MSRQLFEQIVALERAIDGLTKRVEALEARPVIAPFDPSVAVPFGGDGIYAGRDGGGNSDLTFKRGPGRPPKAVHGD